MAWLEQIIYDFPVTTAGSDKLDWLAIFMSEESKSQIYDAVRKYK